MMIQIGRIMDIKGSRGISLIPLYPYVCMIMIKDENTVLSSCFRFLMGMCSIKPPQQSSRSSTLETVTNVLVSMFCVSIGGWGFAPWINPYYESWTNQTSSQVTFFLVQKKKKLFLLVSVFVFSCLQGCMKAHYSGEKVKYLVL